MEPLKVTLKQHTPLIHFQHDQDEGATLRASEVKPKLDQFILNYELDNCFKKSKTHLVGYSEKNERETEKKFEAGIRALNYSLKIIAKERVKEISLEVEHNKKFNTTINGEDFPFLMSNMGGKENKSDLINFTFHKEVELFITTTDDSLKEMIKNALPVFFARNNFGQRKTKGFGSFTVSSVNGKSIEWEESKLLLKKTLLMKFSLINGTNLLDKQYRLFKTLDFYWKCLKSGVNYTRDNSTPEMNKRYIKSFLWIYLDKKGVTWEKRKIKTHFNLLTNRKINSSMKSPIFARALLGCPDKFEYRYKDVMGIKRKNTVSIKHNETIDKNSIARIPTPIIFKPVIQDNTVSIYILIDNSIKKNLKDIANKEFKFSCPTNENLYLCIDPDSIKYMDLLQEFHLYLRTNPEVRSSIFDNVNPADSSNGDLLPRDIRWKNILGGKKFVNFHTIK